MPIQTTKIPDYKITDPVAYWKGLLRAHEDKKLGQFPLGVTDVEVSSLEVPVTFGFHLMNVGSMLDPNKGVIVPRPVINCSLGFLTRNKNDLGLDEVPGFGVSLKTLQDPVIAEGRFYYETPFGLCVARQTHSGYLDHGVSGVSNNEVDPNNEIHYNDVFSKGKKLKSDMPTTHTIRSLFEVCSNCYHFILHQADIKGIEIKEG